MKNAPPVTTQPHRLRGQYFFFMMASLICLIFSVIVFPIASIIFNYHASWTYTLWIAILILFAVFFIISTYLKQKLRAGKPEEQHTTRNALIARLADYPITRFWWAFILLGCVFFSLYFFTASIIVFLLWMLFFLVGFCLFFVTYTKKGYSKNALLATICAAVNTLYLLTFLSPVQRIVYQFFIHVAGIIVALALGLLLVILTTRYVFAARKETNRDENLKGKVLARVSVMFAALAFIVLLLAIMAIIITGLAMSGG